MPDASLAVVGGDQFPGGSARPPDTRKKRTVVNTGKRSREYAL
jgi:hypothetical protein